MIIFHCDLLHYLWVWYSITFCQLYINPLIHLAPGKPPLLEGGTTNDTSLLVHLSPDTAAGRYGLITKYTVYYKEVDLAEYDNPISIGKVGFCENEFIVVLLIMVQSTLSIENTVKIRDDALGLNGFVSFFRGGYLREALSRIFTVYSWWT